MKTLKIIIMSLLIITAAELLNSQKASAQGAISFQVFYDQLGPYGHWVNYPQYGYAWIPSGAPGFIPYSTSGHWVLTEFGWTWVSDFAWGWAPFHYGRWHYDDFYGWLWVPGYDWGPAWVCWRHAPGYYGWAPMPPGVSINVAYGPRFSMPHDRWIFVRERYINQPRLTRYIAPRNENVTIIKNSTVINNTYQDKGRNVTFMSGPRKDDVQRATGTPLKAVALKESTKPEQSLNNNELKMYRPVVQKTEAAGKKPAPQKVVPLESVKQDKGKNNADVKTPKQATEQNAPSQLNQGKSDSKQQPAKPAPAPGEQTDVKREPQQPDVKPSTAPEKKQTDVNREPQQVRPNNVDKSRNRHPDQQKRITPVPPSQQRTPKHDERRK